MIHRGKYALQEKKVTGKEVFIVKMVGDCNDGDYITTEQEMSREQFESVVDELINIQNNFMSDWALKEYDNERDLDIPMTEWSENCHTLEKLEVTHIGMTGKHHDVILEPK